MVFKRIKKGLKKVGKRVVRAAGSVGRSVLAGQGLAGAVRGQLNSELAELAGQGAYDYGKQAAARQRRMGQRVIRGRGDYEVSGEENPSTSVMNPRTAFAPRIKNEVGVIEIKRSEYLGDLISGPLVNGASAFTSENYFVNPGLDLANGGASNWLAPIGAQFQQYRYKQLVFEYRATSGASVASTNTSLGTVIMAAQYDASKPNYPNKQQAMDSQFAVSAAPDKSIMYPVECKTSMEALKLWDVRTGQLLPGQSQNTYDFVNFQIMTQGMQAAGANLGELWVHYTVCLEKTSANSSGTTIRTASYRWTNNVTGQGTAPVAAGGKYLGDTTTKWVPQANNQLPLIISSSDPIYGDAAIIFPPQIQQGTYLVSVMYKGSATLTAGGLQLNPAGNIHEVPACCYSPLSAGQVDAFTSTSTLDSPATIFGSMYVNINAGAVSPTANLVAVIAGTLPANVTDVQISVTEVNINVVQTGT